MLICVLIYTNASAQLNNSFFDIERTDTTTGLITLHVDNLNYFRNVEYKTKIDEGRTLFGYQFWPEIAYQVSTHVQVAGGVFLQRDFGGEGFVKNEPTFSFQYTNGRNQVRFGTLMGSMQHQLVEPLYDPEFIIDNRVENGFQYRHNSKNLAAEVWTDWRKMIYENSPFREEFVSGIRVEPRLVKDVHYISLPTSILGFHKGGEIDTSGLPTETQYNISTGFNYRFKPTAGIDSLDFQAHAIFYEDVSPTPINYIDGVGQYVSLAVYKKQWGLMLNYYDAHQFHNPIGDALYRTVSVQNPNAYVFDYRKLIMARVFYQRPLGSNTHFLFRATYARDLNQDTDDVVAEFYFRWTPKFVLGKA